MTPSPNSTESCDWISLSRIRSYLEYAASQHAIDFLEKNVFIQCQQHCAHINYLAYSELVNTFKPKINLEVFKNSVSASQKIQIDKQINTV
jgi:hypothetical protein